MLRPRHIFTHPFRKPTSGLPQGSSLSSSGVTPRPAALLGNGDWPRDGHVTRPEPMGGKTLLRRILGPRGPLSLSACGACASGGGGCRRHGSGSNGEKSGRERGPTDRPTDRPRRASPEDGVAAPAGLPLNPRSDFSVSPSQVIPSAVVRGLTLLRMML